MQATESPGCSNFSFDYQGANKREETSRTIAIRSGAKQKKIQSLGMRLMVSEGRGRNHSIREWEEVSGDNVVES
jgi:hypothetical protein